MNHSLLLSTYYFFPIRCTIPNDLKIFKHVFNLSRKRNPKKNHHFAHFFIEKWASEVYLPCFSHGPKNDFIEFECLYLTFHIVEISEVFTTCSQISILQDPMVTCAKKSLKEKYLVLVLKMTTLEHYEWKHSHGTLGVNQV